jgi:hypothetical protein
MVTAAWAYFWQCQRHILLSAYLTPVYPCIGVSAAGVIAIDLARQTLQLL